LPESRGIDKLWVVAVRSAKVAALHEDDRADVAGVVDERTELQPAYEHSLSFSMISYFTVMTSARLMASARGS